MRQLTGGCSELHGTRVKIARLCVEGILAQGEDEAAKDFAENELIFKE